VILEETVKTMFDTVDIDQYRFLRRSKRCTETLRRLEAVSVLFGDMRRDQHQLVTRTELGRSAACFGSKIHGGRPARPGPLGAFSSHRYRSRVTAFPARTRVIVLPCGRSTLRHVVYRRLARRNGG